MNLQLFIYFLQLFSISYSFYSTNISQAFIQSQISNYTNFIILPFYKQTQKKVFIFGGLMDGLLTNKLYKIILSTLQYELIQVSNNPQPRYQHCGIVNGNDLYIYGGINQNGTILDDLWVFNYINKNWKKYGNSGVQIQSCSMIYKNQDIYIFGNNKSNLSSVNIKYSISQDKWLQTGIFFIQKLRLKGNSDHLPNNTTQIGLGYININQLDIDNRILSQTIQYSSVSIVSNHNKNYFITTNHIYQINFQTLQIQIIQRIQSKFSIFRSLLSNQWLFILYLSSGSINIAYYSVNNLQINNQFFKIGQIQNINTFQTFLDQYQNIHIIFGQNLTSWVIIKNCLNKTQNIKSCFYSQIKCIQAFTGSTCQIPICSNSLILYDQFSFNSIKFQCSNHGKCTQNGCQCDQYWSGQDCSNYKRTSCYGQVIENWPILNCQCIDQKAGGNYCEVNFCYNDCSEKGICGNNGQCVCNSGYAGPDCSVTIIQLI